jgi:hypothetical protein
VAFSVGTESARAKGIKISKDLGGNMRCNIFRLNFFENFDFFQK